MYRGEFFYKRFKDNFPYDGTEDQDRLFREIADFVTCDDADILVVNGYAGTGKTSAIAAVIRAFDDLRPKVHTVEATASLAFICKRLKLNLKKLSEEEKKWLKKIAQKSDLLKNPNPQRGRK